MQKGIIGKKLGMTQLFDANGKVVPVTIIEAGPCTCLLYTSLVVLGGIVGPAKAIYLPVVLLCFVIPADNLAGPQEYVRGPFGLRVRSGRLIQAATLVLAFGLWLTANLGALAYAARDVSRAALAAGAAALAVMLVLVLRLYAWARTCLLYTSRCV